jgi:hypothetical protein
MPEDAQPAGQSLGPALRADDLLDGPVDAEVLVVLGQLLDQPGLLLLVDDEVLDDVEQPVPSAEPAD